MTESKQVGKITAAVLLAAFLVTGIWRSQAASVEAFQQLSDAAYQTALFDKLEVMQVEISMEEAQWQDLLENAREEKYYECDVTVNGTTYYHSGIRAKGNTSLTMVADSDSDRYSFKIKFDEYVENQSCEGLSELVLNNIYSDATYMKEYLSYDIMEAMGIAVPLYAYSNIRINGENWGLYLALEPMEKEYAYRNFGSSYGALYKVESDRGGGGSREGKSAAGADGVYIDDQISSYSSIFDYAAYDVTKEQKEALILALKNIQEGTDMETYLNVEDTLSYIAANVFLVNLDSYFSNMKHNYYLYEENGQLTMLPWDYNLSFGGFQAKDASAAVNSPIDTPVSGVELEERPFVARLLEKEEYRDLYHEKLQNLLEQYFQNGTFEKTADYLEQLIDPWVKQDATAFYSYEEFKEAAAMLKHFGELRALSVQGQLDGTVPSTQEEQEKQSSLLIDSSSISLKTMGTQGGKEGMGDRKQQAVETGKASEHEKAPSDREVREAFHMQEEDAGRMPPPDIGTGGRERTGPQEEGRKGSLLLTVYGLLLLGIGFVLVKKY